MGQKTEKRFKADCGRKTVSYSLPVRNADLTVSVLFAPFCAGLLANNGKRLNPNKSKPIPVPFRFLAERYYFICKDR